MNYKAVMRITGRILLAEAVLMLPPLMIALLKGENLAARGFSVAILLLALAGALSGLLKADAWGLRTKEGFGVVVAAWVSVSVFGAVPFMVSGEIPSFVDAVFETVSGFTTTGSSILTDVEALPKSLLYWRSFTHWLGGMGVLVFMLALSPLTKNRGESLSLLRAESPGVTVEKLVPHISSSAKILYGIYIAMTLLQIVLMLLGGATLFDSVTITFGTAGTGGFGIKNDSMASYSPYLQVVTTVFMILFAVNFNVYFLLLLREFGKALKNAELLTYLAIIGCSVAVITANVRYLYESFGETLRHAAFQVASIISTTGYATTDFDLWPALPKTVLLFLMFIGASAGSTGGGLKVVRGVILMKSVSGTVNKALDRRRVKLVHMDGRVLDEETVNGVRAYFFIYMLIFTATVFLISLDELDMVTNFSAAASCFNNIGPGLSLVGPATNFSVYSDFSKAVLTIAMLLGRLEIYPILVLLTPWAWRK